MCPVYVKGAGSKAAREALASATSSQILPRKGTQCHHHHNIFIHRNTAQQCVRKDEVQGPGGPREAHKNGKRMNVMGSKEGQEKE